MVAILLANGFEEAEALVPCDILRRGGVEVALVGLSDGMVTGGHGIKVAADLTMDGLDMDRVEMLVLPGGMGNKEHIEASPQALALIRETAEKGSWVCAICAAPAILGGLGLLDGRNAVCYPGLEAGLGAAHPRKGEQVVTDGKFITGEGPGSAYEFGYKLLEVLKGQDAMEEVKHEMHFRY